MTYGRMTINEVIEWLKKEPEGAMEIGFCDAFSYRGYYEDLGVLIAYGDGPYGPCERSKMVDILKAADGKVFIGYKGGRFLMNGDDTSVWLTKSSLSEGIPLTPRLLELMV